MKRWLWYFAVIAAVALFSVNDPVGKDIGKMNPVQVLYMTYTDGEVVLRTDTGDWGKGGTLPDAVASMKAAAVGEIFLETADYLLLSPECEGYTQNAMEFLRPSCTVCFAEGQPEMEQVAAYLQIHPPCVTLARYRAGDRYLQTLITQEGRMELVS